MDLLIWPIQTESTNRGSATSDMVNQNEDQHNEYSTLLHATTYYLLLSITRVGNCQIPHQSRALFKTVVTVQPNWPQIFSGEKITLRCEIQGGGHTEWTYEWTTTSSNTFPTDNRYIIIRATESHSGQYRCLGRRDTYTSTEWSEAITLKVLSYKPWAELTAVNRDIPVGGSVILTCSRYFWYRDEKTSQPLTSQDVVFLSNRRIRVSVGGVYWCRGGRGEPVYYTEYSYSITVNKKREAVVSLQPNWSEIYSGEKITLRCEITDEGHTEWTYGWTTPSSIKFPTEIDTPY
ncbi:high affinity immunoglobulin gamma Fc receptor I-like [Perca flavescens]|uniref:high affinity immunoglobulin gamma Fc receptor I-like n=1 Tax=Perca flavescens TaxID=8167 RepID=UPI00106EFBA5|nr:high affinity immunoglobulin gamma Fc receptor I-like [Perca flavescens]